MEEKNMRELSMDEMDKVNGGAGELETLHTILVQAGVLPEILALPRKQAVQALIDFCNKNGLPEYIRYTQAVYDCF
jgi:hypothetical protein